MTAAAEGAAPVFLEGAEGCLEESLEGLGIYLVGRLLVIMHGPLT